MLKIEKSAKYLCRLANFSLINELDDTRWHLIYKLAKNKKDDNYECEFAFSTKNNSLFIQRCEKTGLKIIVNNVFYIKGNETYFVTASCSHDNEYLKEIEEKNEKVGVCKLDIKKVVDIMSSIDKLLLSEAKLGNFEILYTIDSSYTEYIINRYAARAFVAKINRKNNNCTDEIQIAYKIVHYKYVM